MTWLFGYIGRKNIRLWRNNAQPNPKNMAQSKVTWYSVTIWDGAGSGEKLRYTTNLEDAMRWRKHNRTIEQTDYKVQDFFRTDIPCSQIDVYRLKDGENIKDKEPVLTLTWY